MTESIQVSISGTFPSYSISFGAQPAPVKFGKKATIVYALATEGFRFLNVNSQVQPFDTQDELVWSIPADAQSLILNDTNVDKSASIFGLEFAFSDKAGNRFSSKDPEVMNEGED